MKIHNLTVDSKIYTSNAYLVTGSWNTMEDVNTLIDAGRDALIVEEICNASTGVGKQRVEQIILTHSHYDHAGMAKTIKQSFNARILAYSSNIEGVDRILKDGEVIRIGDASFEIIYMPGHSTDSICIYSREEKVLFAGDSPLIINTEEGIYEEKFISVFKRLTTLPIDVIYFGHGSPIIGKCNEVLMRSLKNITAIKNK
jgi:glyoxylase-like metal-dependent hydrolase (beta-lactamase superfamily II)